MRRILPLLLLATVAACSFPQTRWEKEGADNVLAANDLGYCRKAARDEAFVTYPYASGSLFYGFYRPAAWEESRYVSEIRLTQFCMRAKGYQRATVAPAQATAQVVPATD